MRISSITKSITAVACLQLVQIGLLELDVPITNYLSNFPKHISDKITLRSLMAHTSGYELDRIDGFREELQKSKGMKAVYDLHIKYLPEWEHYNECKPPNKFDYSNDSFDLIAVIIENVSGLRFEEYVSKYVFDIANMPNTSFLKNELASPYRYDIKHKGLANYEEKYPYSLGAISGAGGLKSTASDLANFFNTLYDTDKLLDLPHKSLMFSIVQTTYTSMQPDGGNSPIDSLNTSYKKRVRNGRALGFDVRYDIALNLGHDGTNIGNSAVLRYFPNSDYLLIVLCNNRSGAQNIYRFFINNFPVNRN